ncbi:MAG TPA: PDZ domain-containing protein [Actinomycetales bacterium]|nr:PDZ domain-containing protein [Actinomycetales bacterium]
MSSSVLPTSTTGPAPAPSRLARRSPTALVTGVLSVVLATVVALLPAPYAIYAPGPVTNVLGKVGGKQLITVSGRPTYPARGKLDMTTVEVFGGPGRRLSLAQVMRSWVSPSRAVVPVEQVFPPGQTPQQVKTENAAEMSQSQQDATAAGLRELGLTVPERIDVASVSKDVPAARVLRSGDVITGLNGRPIADSAALRSAIAGLQPGADVTVQVRRDGSTRQLRTTTAQQDGRTVLGVGLNPSYEFPAQVKFATKDVGGPSAGMMFALGIYDLLTPGELTGGQHVAGTGTIDGAGRVGPIGGIAQKLVGARSAGARWFLAPAANCPEVVGNVPEGLQVVRTASLHESRLAIQQIAAGRGAGLPTCTR